jgi:hypothetical protein
MDSCEHNLQKIQRRKDEERVNIFSDQGPGDVGL